MSEDNGSKYFSEADTNLRQIYSKQTMRVREKLSLMNSSSSGTCVSFYIGQ